MLDLPQSIFGAWYMEPMDALRRAIDFSGKSARAVSVEAGRSPNFASSTLSQGGRLTCESAALIAGPCGYSLALVPSGRLPEGSIVIDPPR